MATLTLDGRSLTLEQVATCAYDTKTHVQIAEKAKDGIRDAAQLVADFVAEGRIAYGITTGFGAFKDKLIDPADVALLQKNILLSHATGVGNLLDEPATRAMMLIRANTLARGHSGIRLETLELLLELLNRNILPCIPEKGSLGASGDLAPLAHMSLPLIGEGELLLDGVQMPAAEALAKAGLEPVELAAKEGLALTNGTTLMTAIGALEVLHALQLYHTANLAAALTLEAQEGTLLAYEEAIHTHRPQPYQAETAAEMRALLAGTEFSRAYNPANVQDAYTLRCVPQVHGAVRNAIAYAQNVVEIELNAVTDNPLLFLHEYPEPRIISGGNFHGEPLALALDFLALAMTDLGNISERRTAKLVDNRPDNGPYPAFLAAQGGLNSGFMLLQYTAAALTSENKTLAHPSSLDSIPSSGNVEDHVSMGANAALHARSVMTNLDAILAIELMCACQAIDFRLQKTPGLKQGAGTAPAYAQLRQSVPFYSQDAYYAPALKHLIGEVRAGHFA